MKAWATPQDFGLHSEPALKARLKALVNRAFSADGLHLPFPWGAAQAQDD